MVSGVRVHQPTSMKPSVLNLFMRTFTRDLMVPDLGRCLLEILGRSRTSSWTHAIT
jgi:hypothetical protein